MLNGLTVEVSGGVARLSCPNHPETELEHGVIKGPVGLIRIYSRCLLCNNDGDWKDEAERQRELTALRLQQPGKIQKNSISTRPTPVFMASATGKKASTK